MSSDSVASHDINFNINLKCFIENNKKQKETTKYLKKTKVETPKYFIV